LDGRCQIQEMLRRSLKRSKNLPTLRRIKLRAYERGLSHETDKPRMSPFEPIWQNPEIDAMQGDPWAAN
jgi:hypothetical protein